MAMMGGNQATQAGPLADDASEYEAPVVRPSSTPRSVGFQRVPARTTPEEKPAVESPEEAPQAELGNSERPLPKRTSRPGPPLPKRPKGRLFVGAVMVSVAALLGSLVWNSFLRYEAFGTVQGRIIHLAAPWNGTIQSLCHVEGEEIRQGDLLATVDNYELTRELARTGDQLRVAIATLQSEIAQLRWQAQLQSERRQETVADYYALWAEVLQEESSLAELESRFDRLNALHESGAVADETWDEVRLKIVGQRGKVSKLRQALIEQKQRGDQLAVVPATWEDQLKPHLLRIESLQAELRRDRQQVERGQLRAPVDGRIIGRYRYAGEYAAESDTIYEILECGSLQIVVYVTSQDAARYSPGDTLRICLEADGRRTVTAQVVRLGEQLVDPPHSIERKYARNKQLIPVFLTCANELGEAAIVSRLGTTVKVPRWQW
ncbi:MAG: efflux RND transporter periplasmic adaptor subunit [Planctomycetales bacterium]|nr:efflux RND transporter periplasmic adaptor subunit [Planctomycetales bacterium]